MPSLKDIRRRIRSVKSTQKITQAMKMVAAAKVKRAENRVKANRPYTEELRVLFSEVYETMKNLGSELYASRYGDLVIEKPIKNVGIIVLSSDRGLCGAYNTNILKQTLMVEKCCQAQGLTPKFYLIGNKITRSYKTYGGAEVLGSVGNISAAPKHSDAHAVAQELTQLFLDGKIDAIQILYTRFLSMISYKVTLKPIFPVGGIIDEVQHLIPPNEDEYTNDLKQHVSPDGLHPETLLEPNAIGVLDALVPLYLSNQIYNALLEGSASELAARMTAMSNASRNASEMIGKLTLLYNKARQASITQEILEIVSGANAL